MKKYIYECLNCEIQITAIGEGRNVAVVMLECNACEEEMKLIDTKDVDLSQ